MPTTPSADNWTVAAAKARLSELLRCAEESPQCIGTKKACVVIPLAT